VSVGTNELTEFMPNAAFLQTLSGPQSFTEDIRFSSLPGKFQSYTFPITNAAATRPVITDENLSGNQIRELALAAEVTLKTVESFVSDFPDPFNAPKKELGQLCNYLNAGMSLPYAAKIDLGIACNYAHPQPNVIFPPATGSSYKLEKGTLLLSDTQGGYVALSTLIECLKCA